MPSWFYKALHTLDEKISVISQTATIHQMEVGKPELLQELTFTLWGMGCPVCARLVYQSLMETEAVAYADVNYFTGAVHLKFNPQRMSAASIIDAAARAGNKKHHRYVILSVTA